MNKQIHQCGDVLLIRGHLYIISWPWRMASGMEGIVQFKYKVGPMIAENRRAFIQMGS